MASRRRLQRVAQQLGLTLGSNCSNATSELPHLPWQRPTGAEQPEWQRSRWRLRTPFCSPAWWPADERPPIQLLGRGSPACRALPRLHAGGPTASEWSAGQCGLQQPVEGVVPQQQQQLVPPGNGVAPSPLAAMQQAGEPGLADAGSYGFNFSCRRRANLNWERGRLSTTGLDRSGSPVGQRSGGGPHLVSSDKSWHPSRMPTINPKPATRHDHSVDPL
jgi:hypothetical protein